MHCTWPMYVTMQHFSTNCWNHYNYCHQYRLSKSSEPTAGLLTCLFLLRSGQGQFSNRRLKELRSWGNIKPLLDHFFFQTRLIWLLCLGHWTNQDFLHSIWHLLSLIGSLTASSGVTHLFMSDLQNSQRGNSDSTSPCDLARFTFQTWFI